MPRGGWVVVIVGVALAGCARRSASSFRPDPGYTPRPNPGAVEVFDRQEPERPYDVVGVVVVEGDLTAEQVTERAVAEGRKAGCQLLVARPVAGGEAKRSPLIDEKLGFAGAPVLVAQVTSESLGSPAGGVVGGEKIGRRKIEYACGVWRDGR
jgi:hypothetical protein